MAGVPIVDGRGADWRLQVPIAGADCALTKPSGPIGNRHSTRQSTIHSAIGNRKIGNRKSSNRQSIREIEWRMAKPTFFWKPT
jgi:hypothetical protein